MGRWLSTRWNLLISFVLVAATVGVYWQTTGFEFITFDDTNYVVRNQFVQMGLTGTSACWAFTAAYEATWQPLVWLSYMLDYELGALDPRIYHLNNVLLHAANVLLLFFVLNRMTKRRWASAFVAALFALHPLHVESVAWVAERKDVLSTFFWMLALWFYVRYTERPSVGRYALVTGAFILGLMSKPMLVTLPLMLLLLDYWPLGRYGQAGGGGLTRRQAACRLVREKLPLFALAAAGSVAAFLAQREGGAVKSLEQFPLDVRLGNALVSYVLYIKKTIWPQGLAIFYPHPGSTLPTWQIVVSSLVLVGATIAAVRVRRRHPYLAVGWLWYIITLLPVIGLVQIGRHALADRFTYVPLIGLLLIGAWGVPRMLAGRPELKARLAAAGALLVLAMTACTYSQVSYWRNSITLFRRALEVTKENAIAESNLAIALAERGLLDDAVVHYGEVLRLAPADIDARCNMGIALIRQGKLDEAARLCREALRMAPGNAEAHNNLGVALAKQGKLEQAAAQFRTALRIQPGKLSAKSNLARAMRMIQAKR